MVGLKAQQISKPQRERPLFYVEHSSPQYKSFCPNIIKYSSLSVTVNSYNSLNSSFVTSTDIVFPVNNVESEIYSRKHYDTYLIDPLSPAERTTFQSRISIQFLQFIILRLPVAWRGFITTLEQNNTNTGAKFIYTGLCYQF